MINMAPGTVRVRLSELLKERGMPLAKLVELTGISYNTGLALRRNSNIRIDLNILALICKALDVDVSDILVYEPETENVEA